MQEAAPHADIAGTIINYWDIIKMVLVICAGFGAILGSGIVVVLRKLGTIKKTDDAHSGGIHEAVKSVDRAVKDIESSARQGFARLENRIEKVESQVSDARNESREGLRELSRRVDVLFASDRSAK